MIVIMVVQIMNHLIFELFGGESGFEVGSIPLWLRKCALETGGY